jgi:DNA-binding FadR family transcriptional regulator
MRMSRASIDNLHDQMIREDIQFRKLLALSAKNRLMVSLHECIAGQGDVTLLGSPLPENDKASLFADYVGIFNAVQHRTPEHTHMSIQNHILRQCRLMVERHAIDMPGTITEALLRMQRDPDYENQKGTV